MSSGTCNMESLMVSINLLAKKWGRVKQSLFLILNITIEANEKEHTER